MEGLDDTAAPELLIALVHVLVHRGGLDIWDIEYGVRAALGRDLNSAEEKAIRDAYGLCQ